VVQFRPKAPIKKESKTMKKDHKKTDITSEKRIEEALDLMIEFEWIGAFDSPEGWHIINELRDILCDHEVREYQAREEDTNVPERLFCMDCEKDFDVNDWGME